MAAFAHNVGFMKLVRDANPGYGKWKRSSLHELKGLLENINGTPRQVLDAMIKLPTVKILRYINAIHYVLALYPGLSVNAATFLNMGVLGESNAARYMRTPMPGNFNPTGPQNGRVFVSPPCESLNLTLEQFILSNRRRVGVVLIHLSDDDEVGMDAIFQGRTCLEHMRSVLWVAGLVGCSACALTMIEDRTLCSVLSDEFNQMNGCVEVCVTDTHMGSVKQNFQNFARQHENLIVLGFDASVCVFANVFGANETMPDGSFRPPLSTMANIVMSRAGLSTGGTIQVQTSSFGVSEYGSLANT